MTHNTDPHTRDHSTYKILRLLDERAYDQQPGFERAVLPKPGGGHRIIWMPNKAMTAVHEELRYHLEYRHPINIYPATGGLRGGSPAVNIQAHAGNRYFYQLDFSAAYDQVCVDRLAQVLVGQSHPEEELAFVENFLTEYCSPPNCEGMGLAQGAPCSPYLFNLYCQELDRALVEYCSAEGITYTRYLDDLTFSKPDHGFQTRDTINRMQRAQIRSIVAEHNMNLNPTKSRVSDTHDGPVVVTGIQIDKTGKWRIHDRTVRAAMAELVLRKEQLAGTLFEQDIRDLAAGYKGMLDAAQSPRRPTKNKERLRGLIDLVLAQEAPPTPTLLNNWCGTFAT